MLTILASSQTGMQARHMLERKPPTCMSILSSTTSFCALRRPTSGLDSSSATTSSTGRPLMPPDLLMRSAAISTPTSAVLPPAAPAPESGCIVPILYGLSWPKAARHGAGTNIVAPSAPAPHPTRQRRVTLPLYQNSCELSWSFKSLAIVSSSRWISRPQIGSISRACHADAASHGAYKLSSNLEQSALRRSHCIGGAAFVFGRAG